MATGYGVDTWCGESLVPGRLARGHMLVALALLGRLITPRGTLRGGPEEDAYGLDVSSYLGAVGPATAVAALPGLVRGELMKDDRVSDIQVTASREDSTDGSVAITLEIDVLLVDEDESFALTISVDDVTAEIVGGVA